MNGLDILTLAFGSKDHERSIQLRREVLRWPLGLEFTAEELASESAELVFGAFDDGRLVATLNLSCTARGVFKMRQVAVRPEWQGKGVGRSLVAAVEEHMRKLMTWKIYLHARESAVPFYLALGYQTEGDPFEEVGITHFKMVKTFSLDPSK